MNKPVKNVKEYLAQFDSDQQSKINKMRKLIKQTIDPRFEEAIVYNMLCYVVPLKLYPQGYHVTPNLPLTYIAIAQQKNYFSFYHMGADFVPKQIKEFENDYLKQYSKKLDHGKVCFRFKNNLELPYKLIQNLLESTTFEQYLDWYKSVVKDLESKRSKK